MNFMRSDEEMEFSEMEKNMIWKTVECPNCKNTDLAMLSYNGFRCHTCGIFFETKE